LTEGHIPVRLLFVSDQDDRAAEFASLVTSAGFYACRSLRWNDVGAGDVVNDDIVVIDPPANVPPLGEIERQLRCEGITVFAVLGQQEDRWAVIFSSGFRDYIAYPFIAAEISVRLEGTLGMRALARKQAARSISALIPPAHRGRSPPPHALPNAQERALVEATCRFLGTDLATHLDLDTVARRMGSNRNTLSRAFRHVLGRGVYAWLRHARLEAAADLLEATDLTVQAVSFDVGYEDPANFATAFRQVYGLSPSAYRKAVRNSKT
jgi:AraC-like DNA-binding protein